MIDSARKSVIRPALYQPGDLVNGVKILGLSRGIYDCECLACGHVLRLAGSRIRTRQKTGCGFCSPDSLNRRGRTPMFRPGDVRNGVRVLPSTGRNVVQGKYLVVCLSCSTEWRLGASQIVHRDPAKCSGCRRMTSVAGGDEWLATAVERHHDRLHLVVLGDRNETRITHCGLQTRSLYTQTLSILAKYCDACPECLAAVHKKLKRRPAQPAGFPPAK